MTERKDLIAGRFYWILPVFDADFDGPVDHWWQREQPALYLANEKWIFIGQDSENGEWPVRWIGDEIKMSENAR